MSYFDPSNLGELGTLGLQVLKIIWINILLSGDNAVVIALACRSLPQDKRTMGILLGAGAAVLLRIVFTIGITSLMNLPWLKFIGSLLLFWIAIKLLTDEGHDEAKIAGSTNIWGAVRTVAVADIVMSLDNVLAIAAAARGNVWLIVFGLVISIPLIIGGATLIMALLSRFPALVWAGAALLGWVAGELLLTDPAVVGFAEDLAHRLGIDPHTLDLIAAGFGAAFVVVVGWLIMRMHERRHAGAPEMAHHDRPAE
jgi:YjbE family integral membrane protein